MNDDMQPPKPQFIPVKIADCCYTCRYFRWSPRDNYYCMRSYISSHDENNNEIDGSADYDLEDLMSDVSDYLFDMTEFGMWQLFYGYKCKNYKGRRNER